jgi:two-component sensor histidine kinase
MSMSAHREGRDTVLIVTLSLVLVGGIAVALWAYAQIEARRSRLTEHYLAAQEHAFHARLDGFFLGMEQELGEEVLAIPDIDSLNEQQLYMRWEPLLSSHPSIQRISLADQWGDEIALLRGPSGVMERRVYKGSTEGPAIESYRSEEHPGYDSLRLADEARDPRRETWFAKALEDNQGAAAWNLTADQDGHIVLQVAQLLRARGEDLPLRVLMFEVDLQRSRWLDTRTLAYGALDGILFDAGRNVLGYTRSSAESVDDSAAAQLVARVMDPASDLVFMLKDGDTERMAKVEEHALNGALLYAMLLLEPDFVNDWVSAERLALIVGSALLVVIGILLLWIAIRSRNRSERVRQTAKKIRSLERRLNKTTGERDVLNREVHHRVKNNLQVVSSLLNLQASRLEEGPVRSEFLRGKRRIDIIALVHHKMYDLKDLRNVDVQQFFEQLIAALAQMHEPLRRSVSHEVQAQGVKADQDTAIELGIILCELVTNTYEHAFPYATGGHVDITVQAVDSELHRLLVRDNGKGLDVGRIEREGKLGLEIVEALAEQMNGSLHTHSGDTGATFEVLFRKNWNRSANELPDAQGGE